MQARQYPAIHMIPLNDTEPDTIYYTDSVDKAIAQAFNEWNNQDGTYCAVEVHTHPGPCDLAVSDYAATYSQRLTLAQVAQIERKARAHDLAAIMEPNY